MSAAFLRAPRRQHRRGGAARRPGGGAGPPAPRPALPRPSLRVHGDGRAARGSSTRPHGDRRLSPGEGRGRGRRGQQRPGSSERQGAAAGGASDACGAEVGLRCMLQQSTAAWRAPSCCWRRRPRWTSRTSTAGGLSRCHNRFENSFSPAISTNSCSSMWHVLMT